MPALRGCTPLRSQGSLRRLTTNNSPRILTTTNTPCRWLLLRCRVFQAQWGSGIQNWTDLPCVPLLYGLAGLIFGRERVVFQLFVASPSSGQEREAGSGSGGTADRDHRSSFFKSPAFWVRLLLGAIFIYASFDKILHPEAFAKVINNYQILPGRLINLTAIVLPWTELILGCLLILGWWLPGASLLTNLLLVTFFAALAFNLARGLSVHCGCFGSSSAAGGDPATLQYLARDLVLVASSIYLSRKVFKGYRTSAS